MSRAKAYHATHTDIAVLGDDQSKIDAMREFLKKYPGIDFYETAYYGHAATYRLDAYVNNGYNKYKVLSGKPLDCLERDEIAIPVSTNDRFKDYFNDFYRLGSTLSYGGKSARGSAELKIASIIDNVHVSENNYNALSVADYSFRDYGFGTIVTTGSTIDHMKSLFKNNNFGIKFKVYFTEYSKTNESKFVLALNNEFKGDAGNTLDIRPFYQMLETTDATSDFIGNVMRVGAYSVFFVLVFVIYVEVSRDYRKNKRQLAILKTVGVSDNKLTLMFFIKYIVICMVAALIMIHICVSRNTSQQIPYW